MRSLYLIVILLFIVGCGSPSKVIDENNDSEVLSTIPSPNIEDSSKKPPSIPNI